LSNVILVADIHASDSSPASRREGYKLEVLDLLWQTVELAKEHKATAVWAGDVFHLKTPGRNSHQLVNEMIDVVRAYPHGLLIVPGNHDLTSDRLDSIPAQPLGTLFKAGAVRLNGIDDDFGTPLYGVPWQQRFNDTTVSAALADWRSETDPDESWLCVTHAPLYPPGKELPYEFYDTAAWAAAMGHRGSVFYGHVHNPHGTYEVEGVTFCNNGALSRGSLDESNLARPVLATLWSSISGLFRTVPLQAQRAEDIFKMEVKTQRAAQVKLDDFLASIGQTSIDITTVDSVMAYVHGLGLGAELEAVIQELIDAAQ
jgi:predicted phosphodiesterase